MSVGTARSVEKFLNGDGGQVTRNKRELILDLCRGKNVLDLGAVQHSWKMSLENSEWLHAAICDVALKCVGVDYLGDDVAELNRRGFHMVVGDVLTDAPPEVGAYDVVVAGDIIEHLENPGVFMEYIAAALAPGGVAVITTPSALYPAQWWTLLGRRKPAISPEHAVLFDPFTFEKLVGRGPLKVSQFYWLTPSWWAFWDSGPIVANLVGRPLHFLTKLLLRWRPYLNSDFAAVVELRKPGDQSVDPSTSAREVMDYLRMPE